MAPIYFGTTGTSKLFAGSTQITKVFLGTTPIYTSQVNYSVSKINNATNLSVNRTSLVSATVGNFALFTGGGSNSTDTYNATLTRGSAAGVSTTVFAGTNVGNFSIFFFQSGVRAFNTSLTQSTPTDFYDVFYRGNGATGSIGNFALYAGGSSSFYGNTYTFVDAYNTSLTRSVPTALSVARDRIGTASVGNFALFAGGRRSEDDFLYSTVDAYNTALTRSSATALTTASDFLTNQCVSIGNFALFTDRTMAVAYNTSLTQSTPSALSPFRENGAAASFPLAFGLIGGGTNVSNGVFTPIVEAYNTALTKTSVTSFANQRSQFIGGRINNYLLFAGGRYGNLGGTIINTTAVEVYEIVES